MTQPITKTLMNVIADSAAIENGVDNPAYSFWEDLLAAMMPVPVVDVVVAAVVVKGITKIEFVAGLLNVSWGEITVKRNKQTLAFKFRETAKLKLLADILFGMLQIILFSLMTLTNFLHLTCLIFKQLLQRISSTRMKTAEGGGNVKSKTPYIIKHPFYSSN